jgi:Rrf2 family protein
MVDSILKISEALTMGMHACAMIGSLNPGEKISSKKIAAELSYSSAHLSKVMRLLVRAGIIKSVTGPSGGFEINKPLEEITLMSIYEAVEGKFPGKNCLLNPAICSGRKCVFGKFIYETNSQIRVFFSNTKLEDLIKSRRGQCFAE